MNRAEGLEHVACPYCGALESSIWTQERGFDVVRCGSCDLIFVNPRLSRSSIDAAVRSGVHGEDAEGLGVASRRVARKVNYYRRLLERVFADVWQAGKPISWLDVGAGYGEFIEAVTSLAPRGSRVRGLEPMRPKAVAARARGLDVVEDYLRPTQERVQFVSMIDVFSHVPDFRAILADVRAVLEPGGEFFMETGNLADLASRADFPGELGVPDHLVFAGEKHLRGYVEQAGFQLVDLHAERIDGLAYFAKTVVKRALGRPEHVRLPFTSPYRQLLVRARLRPN